MNRLAINNHAILNGKLRPTMQLKGIVSIPGGYEHYFGEYEITPKIEEQRYLTKDKVMSEDITVKSIPTYEVTNLQGGTTFIIGGDSIGS